MATTPERRREARRRPRPEAPALPLCELGKSGQGRPTTADALPRDRVELESDQSFPASDPPSR
jgi:hypothetical protein